MPVTGPQLLTPFIPGAGTEEESVPSVDQPTDVTALGERLYDALMPLAYDDKNKNWPLLRYADSLMQAGQQADTYGRDTGDIPGWGILMNPDTCPGEALDWLAQMAGVDLSLLKRATIIGAQQNMLLNPNFKQAVLAKPPLRWVSSETVKFEVTEGWEAGKKALFVETKVLASGKVAYALSEGLTSIPLFSPNPTLIEEGKEYSVRANVKVATVTGTMTFALKVEFYNINGELLQEFSTAPESGVGVHLLSGVFKAPVNAVAAIYKVVATSGAAASKATFYIAEAAMSPTPEGFVMAYGDGDTTGWSWSGEAGNSSSGKLALQTDAEFTAAKRSRIKTQPASERGTPAAILAAVQQYLIGNKTVFLKERDGGAYKLTVVTYEEQTPNPGQVAAALAEQVPGGIILTYATVPGATYIVIRASYATYKAVKEAFKTYNGLRLNLPGT